MVNCMFKICGIEKTYNDQHYHVCSLQSCRSLVEINDLLMSINNRKKVISKKLNNSCSSPPHVISETMLISDNPALTLTQVSTLTSNRFIAQFDLRRKTYPMQQKHALNVFQHSEYSHSRLLNSVDFQCVVNGSKLDICIFVQIEAKAASIITYSIFKTM